MSLHNLAHHLQSAGRGEDKVLVHMTPGEVQGLQSLAMAHGGSLTINPQTGLPEAGILSSLLPIVAGAFLGPAGLGLSAMNTALAVGAAGTLATGSLGKGLMMGFGAYGGAGLGEGLMGAGETALANAAPTVAEGTASTTAEIGAGSGMQNASDVMKGGFAETSPASTVSNTGGLNAYQPQGPFSSAPNGINAGNYQLPNGNYAAPPTATDVVLEKPITYASSANPTDYTSKLAEAQNDPLMERQVGARDLPTKFDKVKAGFNDVTSSGTKAWDFVKAHPSPFIGLGVGALQSYQEQKAKDAAAAAAGSGSPGMIRPYEYSVEQNQSAYAPNASTAERQYFVQPRFIAQTPYAAKEGGLMGLKKYAVGGAVEQMSAQNAISGNTMYPQAQLQTDIYSNPMVQRPMPNNVINSGVDAPVDPYTGEAKFADGGATGSGQLDLHVPINLGGAGGAGGAGATASANGYSAVGSGSGGATDSTAATQLVPPAQATQPPAPMMPQGHQYMPNIQWQSGDIMHGGMSGPLYTSGDPQADAWVRSQQNSVLSKTGMDAVGNHKPEIENLYKQYYQGYAKGGVVGLAEGGMAHYEIGGIAAAKATEPTTDTKYSFDPKTQQYTATTTSTPASKGNGFFDNVIGGFGQFNTSNSRNYGNQGISNGAYFGLTPALLQMFGGQQQAPQPTTTTEVSGGLMAPAIQAQPQTQPANPIAPNINIPQAQPINQQLGLESFYPMMEQQLAAKGAQMQSQNMADGGMAGGGYNLGGYSDGGRLLKGPGDGVSDSIPASIGNRQPARLADGEFVVPARIVSEIGNGSTEAGARKLYAMMDRVQKARGKTMGKNKVAVNTKAEKLLPA